jgi:hypothetical protein
MEKENKHKKDISKEVIAEIEARGIKMMPRSYFIFKSFMFVGLIFLLSLFTLYIGSLIVFVLRANEIMYFQGMGFHALMPILRSFPWYLVSLAIVLIIVVEIVSKRFQFVYRKPLLYSLIVIILFTVAGSYLIERSSVHQHLFMMAQREELPVVGRMYRNLGNLDIENAYFGKVIEKEGEDWIMELENGERVSLEINRQTKGRRIYLEAEEGDSVLVIGEMKDGSIDVQAFRRVPGRFKMNER